MSSQVRRVFAQVGPDRVTEGFYVVRGNTLVMVNRDGSPLSDSMAVSAKLPANATVDQADALARVLAKKIRRALIGEIVPGFERGPVAYPFEVVA